MIEKGMRTKKAKNGMPVFSIDGVHPCSTYFPDKVARQWVQERRKTIEDVTVVLLGLGCGYYANALAESCHKNVIVVEKDPRIVSWYHQNSFQQLSNVDIHILENINNEGRFLRIKDRLRNSYVVLNHPNQSAQDRFFYQNIFNDLAGRTIRSLQKQVLFRSEQKSLVEALARQVESKEQLLSINDVTRVIESEKMQGEVADKWRCLMELVK